MWASHRFVLTFVWCAVDFRGTARYEWAKDGFGDLLMMALPHHMDMIDAEGEDIAVVMSDGYQCMKVRSRR